LTRDRRWEVARVFLLFGSLGLNFGFDVGVARFLLGGSGSVVDGCVFALSTRSDSEELVESQDARFAAAVAFLTFVEDGEASYCVLVGLLMSDRLWRDLERTVVIALLFGVGEGLAAAAMHALRSHGEVFAVDMSVDIAVFFGVWSQWRG
jgi:hypothetical protein